MYSLAPSLPVSFYSYKACRYTFESSLCSLEYYCSSLYKMSRLRRQPWNRWVPRTIFARILVSGLLGTCLLVYILLSALGRHHPVPDVIPVLEKAVSYEKTGKVSDLRPRAGDTSYTGQITTGRMLFCLLQNPNADQSTWTYDDLDTWGWEEFEISAHKISDYQNDYILDAYNDLGINTSDDIGRAYGGLEPYPKTAPEEDQQEVIPSINSSV